jgi:hypothetical protein
MARIEPLRTETLPAKLQELIGSGRAIDKGPPRYLPTPIHMKPGEEISTDFVREQRQGASR